MASFAMTSSLSVAAATVSRRPSVGRRSLIVAQAAKSDAAGKADEGANGRRAVMLAVVAGAALSAVGSGQGVAMAGEGDPPRGTPEAKKIYAPVCVTMPTARICHK